MIEFGDLQCPVCKGFAEEILPPIVEGQVRNGEATLEFRNFTIINEESVTAGAAAVAAGRKGAAGTSSSSSTATKGLSAPATSTDEFLTAIAEAAEVPDIAKWNQARKSADVISKVESTTAEAERIGFGGTPSFAVEGPGTKGLEAIGTPSSTGALESALESAAG